MKALDLLGRELSVGDHVVYGVSGYGHSYTLLHGEITKVDKAMVLIKPLVSGRRDVWKLADEVCAIVLPNIQNPEEQLA